MPTSVKMSGSGGDCPKRPYSEEKLTMNEPMVKLAGLYEKTSQKEREIALWQLEQMGISGVPLSIVKRIVDCNLFAYFHRIKNFFFIFVLWNKDKIRII